MLFGALPRAQNRAFWCSPPCQKSCFLVLSLVPKIVLFGALLRALLSFVQTSCYRSCFLVLSFVHKIVLFVVVPRAKNRAFWCSPSCRKPRSRSCFLVLPFVHKIVPFGALLRATNRAFWCFPSCQKSCSRSCFFGALLCAKNRALDRARCYRYSACVKIKNRCIPGPSNVALFFAPMVIRYRNRQLDTLFPVRSANFWSEQFSWVRPIFSWLPELDWKQELIALMRH